MHRIWWLTVFICPVTDDVNLFYVTFNHLRLCLPGFSAVIVNYFVLTNKYFGREILGHKYAVVIKLLPARFSTLQILPNDDLPIPLFLLHLLADLP